MFQYNKLIQIVFLSFFLAILCLNYSKAETVIANIDCGSETASRILTGTQSNEYWLVIEANGLGLLSESPPGTWTLTYYQIGYVYDATGPDNNGRLWCSSYVDGIGTAVQVFDCNQRTVIQNIYIGTNYINKGIVLSSDQTHIYLVGCDWPRYFEAASWVDAPGHPNTGLVWEIDTSTYAISPYMGEVGVMPETIYYSENGDYDKLFVYTIASDGIGRELGDNIDILSVQRELERTGGLPSCIIHDWSYCNDLVKWSDEYPLMAICNKQVAGSYDIVDNPKSNHGLWVFDTNLEEFVDTYEIIDISGHYRGVSHLCRSTVRPGIAYLSLGFGGLDAEIAVFDMGCGEVIEHIQLGIPFTPEFIYEIPDGRLIATGDMTHNIVIFDPLS
jgi:hypothetical protein